MGFFTKKEDFLVKEGGISEVEKVTIGQIDQTILIQAEDRTNPVLLFLHGGPSMPIPGVSSKGRDYTIATNTKELIENFVVVFWDQRGTGKSYHKDIDQATMNVAQFVADTIELTDYLIGRFQHEKIFLVGHSWGTVIGLKAISQEPKKYFSYTGISQLVDWSENDRLSMEWTKEEARKRNNKRALLELAEVGEPPFLDSKKQWGVLRTWQRNFNTFVYKDPDKRYPKMMTISMDMLRSKEYSLKDIGNTFGKGFSLVYTDDFIRSLAEINFISTTPKVEVPVTFIHGSKDVHVHGQLIEEYFALLHSEKGKQLVWMEKSGHVFHPDDSKLIEGILIKELQHM